MLSFRKKVHQSRHLSLHSPITLHPPLLPFHHLFFHLNKKFMRKTFLLIMIGGAFSACNNDTKVAGTAETKNDKSAVTMPMPVTYSSSFEMGDPKYSAMIVQGSWKDWVDNSMDNMKSWVADTLVAYQ